MTKYYITTAIDYVNSSPHIGHALEKVQADVAARYQRLQGKEVFFVTGTDEHGAKIARSAKAKGVGVEEFVEGNVKIFQELWKELRVSNDYFIRTTDQKHHWPAVEKVWRQLEKNGDLYKKTYEGLYCVGHEAFITQKDLVDGKCSLHKKEPEKVQEENIFFRLSKYSEQIKQAIEKKEMRIVPDSAENEMLRLIEEGLEDISFSRPRKDLQWGIPVPGDNTQTIYVWADALVNYISAIGYGDEDEERRMFAKYWPADVHVIGKDILRFHAAIWPGILFSLGLPLPKTIFVHGFISMGGEKMSKSLGNVVDPFELVKKYGADATRYYLMREIPPTRDGDFTYEKFADRYSGDLAKGLGNLVARVVSLGAKYIEGPMQGIRPPETEQALDEQWREYHGAMEEFRFDDALKAAWILLKYADKRVDSTKLWEISESHPDTFREIIGELCIIIATVSSMIRPVMPGTSFLIDRQLGIDVENIEEWKFLLKKGEALFPRID
ncbi:MAG: methionine--tRNA ligase [Candidatus Spechtbacteria bacterium]|nr:methionine--tRNA ligase [Candidatus Spechtbacteria bacterium]